MDSRDNPTIHPVTNILSKFIGNWVCVDSIGKLVSPLVVHSPLVIFLYEDYFPTASRSMTVVHAGFSIFKDIEGHVVHHCVS
jgi:hypothetical protein